MYAFVSVVVLLAGYPAQDALDGPVLRRGDRVCLIGNALAERMQHHGWLETQLQMRLPRYQLRFRNLGFGGDTLTVRQRTAGFGSPDDHLARCKADVIFAFFGYNESFDGAEGLDAFKQHLHEFIAHTTAQKYNGDSAPRLVLFSPVAHADLADPNLPDGHAANGRIKIYARAMAEVAAASGVHFVDLFGPTRVLFQRSQDRLTLNGIHLNELGNRHVAQIISAVLMGEVPSFDVADDSACAVREAVLDKNRLWFNRYRATDGYNVYGGRSGLKYTDDISNFTVLQRELEILDVMTANRDERIWALANGRDIAVDDRNAPPPIIVKTNKPGTLDSGDHEFPTGEAAITHMQVADGMRINLFASEEQFPELVNPVQMAWDTQNRLWVAAWPTYPHWAPGEPMNDKLLILEDTNQDGRADTCTTFADNLHNPTGFEFWMGGVLLGVAPDLMFLKDTDGDDVADVRQRWLHGLSSADTHHSANSFVVGPDGALYFQEGTFHQSQIETIHGPMRNHDGAVWRFEPRTFRVERYIPYNFANPHGHVFDRWGQNFVTDGTGNENYFALGFSGYVPHPDKQRGYFRYFRQRSRPCAGTEILSSTHFPPEHQGNLLIADVIQFKGLLQYRFQDDGSSFTAVETEPIVQSTHPTFRPSDIEMGPDGAIYFLDWTNPIIGHMQHHLRDPSRDHKHGRVYRVTVEGRQLLKPPAIAGQPIAALLPLLEDPNDRVRYRTRIELSGRDTSAVVTATGHWVKELDPGDMHHEHHLLEALWLQSQHNVLDRGLLERLLEAQDHRARAAATRVVRHMRQHIPDALALLKSRANDAHARVRLEAVVAASYFDQPEAATLALESLRHSHDRTLDYALNRTIKTLEPIWKPQLLSGQLDLPANASAMGYLLERLSAAELISMQPVPHVNRVLLAKHGVDLARRYQAAEALAKHDDTTPVAAVLAAVLDVGRSDSQHCAHVIQDLAQLLENLAADRKAATRQELLQLIADSPAGPARQLGFAQLIVHDRNADAAAQLAGVDLDAMSDLMGATGMITIERYREKLAPIIRPLMFAVPDRLKQSVGVTTDDGKALNRRILALRRAAVNAMARVPGRGIEKFRDATLLIGAGSLVDAAVAMIDAVPVDEWPTDVRPLINTIAAYGTALPAEKRTEPQVLAALELGRRLARSLAAKESTEMLSMLDDLGSTIILIRTVPHQMLYDVAAFQVAAGQPLAIVLQNNDMMPHNFVITSPGRLATVGLAAEKLAAESTDKDLQNYIPQSEHVLQYSRLLRPGETQRLSFVAPTQTGDYPFVCTFPGHWTRMNGTMKVVDRVVGDPVLARTQEVIEEIAVRQFVKSWKMSDLISAVEQDHAGRSIERGEEIFEVAGCNKCHAFNGTGATGGPDLSAVHEKYQGTTLLQQLLEPSCEINEDYIFHTFVLDDETEIFARIAQDNGDVLHLVTNLQAADDITVVQKSRIRDQIPSQISAMPTGLLVVLSREEILDLLAYLQSGKPPQ